MRKARAEAWGVLDELMWWIMIWRVFWCEHLQGWGWFGYYELEADIHLLPRLRVSMQSRRRCHELSP